MNDATTVAMATEYENPILRGIRQRLEAEKQTAASAERDIRAANDRYAKAMANAKALESLLGLYDTYAKNGDFTNSQIPY